MNAFTIPNLFFGMYCNNFGLNYYNFGNTGFNNPGFKNFYTPSVFDFLIRPYNFNYVYDYGDTTGKEPATQIKKSFSDKDSTVKDTNKRNIKKKEATFLTKTKQIAKRINCSYKDLLALMNSESGLNEKAVNSSSGATGLIQFMPATAKELGTSTEELRKMTALEQLSYVEKYLVKNKKMAGFKDNEKIGSGELYALVFLPARAKREILTDSTEKYYAANAKALDLNKDGKITKTELAQRLRSHRVNESIFLS